MLEAWDEAADIAVQIRNEEDRVDAMNMIMQRCRDPSIRPRILEKLQSMPEKKKKKLFVVCFDFKSKKAESFVRGQSISQGK